MSKVLPLLNNKKWHYIHRRFRTPFYTYLIWHGSTKHLNQNISFSNEFDGFLYLDKEIAVLDSGWEEIRKKVNQGLEKNPRFLVEFLHQAYDHNQQLVDYLISLPTSFNKDELLPIWQKYSELSDQFAGFCMLPLFVEADLEQELQNKIDHHFPVDKRGEVFQVLTTPLKAGVAAEAEQDLLDLSIKLQQGEDITSDIDFYLLKYSWITNNAFDGCFMTKNDLVRRLEQEAKGDPELSLAHYIYEKEQQKKNFDEYYQQFEQGGRDLIDTLQESIYFRGWRTERFYRNAYYCQELFAATAKYLGLEIERDLFYVTPPEVINILTGEALLNSHIIAERKNGYGILSNKTETFVFSGKELDKAKKLVHFDKGDEDEVISGRTAYPGKVQGRAIVISSRDDFNHVHDGDILVAHATTVDFISVLSKVAALVIEEGGVLSHASVISREMRIPCIIGAKRATEKLKSGDIVEVDAGKGTIRKIN